MRNSLLLLAALVNVTFSQHYELVYVPKLMNWTNAQSYCRQHYSDLVTVYDQTNHDELLKTAGMGKFWLGLHRTTGNGVFVWSDQGSSSFTRWKLNQPENQLCVTVQSGYWFDVNCEDYFAFACYFGRKRQILRLEVKSSQNMNDLVVMNEILTKMEQILEENGLAQHANLSWRTQSIGNVFQNSTSTATKQT